MKKTLLDWVSYIQGLHTSVIDLGLQRVAVLAQQIGLTEFSCPVITVAGTNGKGSTVCFLESIYKAAGYRVAAYTSPHLMHFNERLRINGEPIDDASLIHAFEEIESRRQQQSLSFFEFTTLAILHICQQLKLDVLLLEIGLGGRLDAVNVVEPDLSIITNIAIDHVDWLGSDRESIGAEKAGILRQGKPAICGDIEPPESIARLAIEKEVSLLCLGHDYDYTQSENSWTWQGPEMKYLNLPVPKLKLQNAATSLMGVTVLQDRLPVTQYAILAGLRKVELPGRFEISSFKDFPVIFDVAHNPQSVMHLAEQISQLDGGQAFKGKTRALVGMLKDKDIEGALLPMIPLVDVWYTADLDTPRGEKSVKINANLAANAVKSCYNSSSVELGLQMAISECEPGDRIIVFGSFHTVSEAKLLISAHP